MKARRAFWLWLAVFYAGIVAVIGAFAVVAALAVGDAPRQALRDTLPDALPALVYAAAILAFAGSTTRYSSGA